jgi:AmmeMemoRadiSam system protein B
MSLPERPQLRPHLAAAPEDRTGRQLVIWDQLRLSDCTIRLTALELKWMQLLDGTRTLREVQSEAMRQVGGRLIPLEIFGRLASALDEALFLDSPRFRDKANAPIRPPSCLGSYEPEPGPLRRQIERLFKGKDGPGLPAEGMPDGKLRAALVPHIDYGRGGVTFAWGFKEIVERAQASLFVIIGTSHYSGHRFTLTRKHFQTPLGVAETDQGFVDRLVAHYGDGLFDDEWLAHFPEHSIELEVVLLQYLYEGKRPFRIVPLVVGSFHDCVEFSRAPTEAEDIARMVKALRAAERAAREPVCYLISGDLAHIGPKFGDPELVSEIQLENSRLQDQALLRRAEAVDPAGYFRVIADELDGRRICGLPPTYTVLEALKPGRGKLLHYDQYVHPRGHESVSFASMAFYDE